MVDFEQVIAIKWNSPGGIDYESIYSLADHFNIIDNSQQPVRSHKLGGRGFISVGIEIHPPHYIAIWDTMESGSYGWAQAQWDKI